ncbi:TPA: hypothetical protein ACGOVF_000233 [Streptococcus suis]
MPSTKSKLKDYIFWLALLLFATVGTARSAFWSKEWTLKANWQIYLCIAFLLVGAWIEFFS